MKKAFNILEINGYSDFSCIGPECENDCCKGWRIIVDKNTYFKYLSIKDKEIRNSITKAIKKIQKSNGEYGILKLDEDKRCKLQMDDNLCYIHKNLGENYLCRTCMQYPKMVNKVYGTLETSYTLSCPEAARKILLDKNKKEFNFYEEEFDTNFINIDLTFDENNILHGLFWDIRSATIEMLQQRQHKLSDRIIIIGLMYKALENDITNNDIHASKANIKRYLDIIKSEEKLSLDFDIDENKKYEMMLEIFIFLKQIILASEININNLSLDSIDLNEDRNKNIDLIKEFHDKMTAETIEKYEYIFENYLVNYIFQNIIPLSGHSVLQQFYKMVFNYAFIIILLTVKSIKDNVLTDKSIIDVIYLFTRSITHSKEKLDIIEENFKNNNLYDLAHITLLIK